MPGPAVRTDIVEVYVFRRGVGRAATTIRRGGEASFLQLRRSRQPLAGSWQPVMGHVEPGETAVRAALRELWEETGCRPGRGLLNFWQLEAVNTYYLASLDCVMLSPGFAAEVEEEFEPVLDAAHDAARWVRRDAADRAFLWPGQRHAVEQVVRDVLAGESEAAGHLRIELGSLEKWWRE